MCRWNILRNYI